MYITQLHLYNFRNISELKLELSPRCNIFYGANGTGKSSVLEALYYLSTARSFRSHLATRIVRYNQDKFVLYANVTENGALCSTQTGSQGCNQRDLSSSLEFTRDARAVNERSLFNINDGCEQVCDRAEKVVDAILPSLQQYQKGAEQDCAVTQNCPEQYTNNILNLSVAEHRADIVKVKIPIGIERPVNGATKIQINGVNATVPELAELLPMQLLHQDSFELLTAGPKYRRKFIDWGMFHVEHSFLFVWKNAKRALEQRNAILRTKRSCSAELETLMMWNRELAHWGMELHKWRAQYIAELLPIINDLVARLLGNHVIQINYYAGWNTENDLYQLLQCSITRDQELGFTQFGPHRADLRLLSNNVPVQDCLSRGQQKIFIFALHLAQGLLLHKLTSKTCVYLIDDLAAELDQERQEMITAILHEIEAQIFATKLSSAEILEHMISERL